MAIDHRIDLYIADKSAVPFSWSENNCMSFVVEYIADHRLPLEWFLGHNTAKACFREYRAKAKHIGYDTLADVFDTILTPELTFYPRDGFIAARPVDDLFKYAYGLCYKGRVYFFSDQDRGLIATDPECSDMYWSAP